MILPFTIQTNVCAAGKGREGRGAVLCSHVPAPHTAYGHGRQWRLYLGGGCVITLSFPAECEVMAGYINEGVYIVLLHRQHTM